jgi:hypothetical protein
LFIDGGKFQPLTFLATLALMETLSSLRVDLGEHVLADRDVPVVGLFGLAFDLVVLSDEWFQIEAEDVVVLWSSGICSY